MRGLVVFFFVALIAMVIPGCNYERMNDQEALKTFKKEMPVMDKRTVPVEDGFQVLARPMRKVSGTPCRRRKNQSKGAALHTVTSVHSATVANWMAGERWGRVSHRCRQTLSLRRFFPNLTA